MVSEGTERVRALPTTELLLWEEKVSVVTDDGDSTVEDDNVVYDGWGV